MIVQTTYFLHKQTINRTFPLLVQIVTKKINIVEQNFVGIVAMYYHQQKYTMLYFT